MARASGPIATHRRAGTLLSGLLLVCTGSSALAAEPFTPAQLDVIERMLAQQRDAIRSEILAELAASSSVPPAAMMHATPNGEIPDLDNGDGGVLLAPAPGDPDLEAVPLDRGMGNGISGLELEANGDDGEVRATLAHRRAVPDHERSIQFGWAVTASSSLDDKDNGRGHFTTLDALSGGTSLQLGLTYASTPKIRIDENGVPSKEWSDLCAVAGQAVSGCTLAAIDKAARKDRSSEVARAYEAFQQAHYGWGRLYELRIGGGKDDFEFLSPELVAQDDTRSTWSLGGSIGFAAPRRTMLYALGFDYQRTYEQHDQGVYCPAPAPPTTTCIAGRLGAPDRTHKRLAWAEARSRVFGFPFAFRVTHDLAGDETGVDVPMYLFRGEGKPFAGGVRWGWTSEDGAGGGIFIGSAFDVFR